jgi:hypothetical protein
MVLVQTALKFREETSLSRLVKGSASVVVVHRMCKSRSSGEAFSRDRLDVGRMSIFARLGEAIFDLVNVKEGHFHILRRAPLPRCS